MADVSRQPICSLEPKMQNTVVIGVIIRSQNSKIIDPTRTRYNNVRSTAVWNFTIRDTIDDFINVTAWGTVEYINNIFTSFPIGTVVELINTKITDRKVDDPNEVYVPSVTSPHVLTLNQNSSLIQRHDSPATARYLSLLNVPTKNPNGAYDLAHIISNIDVLKNQYVDVFVAVTFVSQTREIVTRKGELTKIREFEVSDASTEQVVCLTLWDSEWIRMADKWEPKETVLFLADALVAYNERMKKSSLTIARKTVITENPDMLEAEAIRRSMKEKPEIGSTSRFSIPNPNSITKKMNILEITARLNHALTVSSEDRFQLLVIVQALVDNINLDSDDPGLISARCAKCKRLIANGNDSCMNLECPFGSGMKSPMNVVSLNVSINLKDDTGYLIGCHLRDSAAEQAFGVTADVLKEMTKDQRKRLKEKYYKKVCNVRMQIIGPTMTSSFQKPMYNILSIDVYQPDEEDQFEPLNVEELFTLDTSKF